VKGERREGEMKKEEDLFVNASSADGILRTTEQMRKWAESIGCVAIEVTGRQLFVDIALQACLGSDLTRELLSVKRAGDGEENVVVFFEKKEGEKEREKG
jgi:hypothetical protein